LLRCKQGIKAVKVYENDSWGANLAQEQKLRKQKEKTITKPY
jgi:hypothetical protein